MNLITGATGHIGNVLVRHLLEIGQKVRTLVMPEEDQTPLRGLDVEIVRGDILDAASLEPAFRNVDTVFHLAGMISILPGRNDLLRSVNISGTRNIIYSCKQAGIRRLVYSSSIHALQRVPHGTLIDERVPFDPVQIASEYDHSKAQASIDVLMAAKNGLDAVVVCPTGVIGPYDFRKSEIGGLILDCLKKKPQFYFEGAYDFVDVRDVASGMILAAEKGLPGESYILSGERLTVRGLMDTVRKQSGRRFALLKVPFSLAHFASRFTPLLCRLGEIRPRFTTYSLETLVSNANISHEKARQELGYNPRPLVESLKDTVAWFLENRSLFGLRV